jgi:hypothetical protein
VNKALRVAELLKEGKELPILGQLLDNREREMILTAAKKAERKKDSRNVYITECYSGNWRKPTHKIANRLAKKHGLGWFRPRMCYKRYTNLKEMLLADCAKKVMKCVIALPKDWNGFVPKKVCGCQNKTKVNGKCLFEGQCRAENIIYKIIWLPTMKFYIGKTQDCFKKRTNDHIGAVAKFWKSSILSSKHDDVNPKVNTKPPSKKTPHKKTLTTKKPQRGRPPKPKPQAHQTNKCGLSPLIDMLETLTNTYSSETQSSNDEFSQPTQLIPKTAFQAEFGMELNAKDQLDVEDQLQETTTKEDREKKIACSELSKYIWSKAEKQNFKTVGALNIWIRSNLKVEIVHRSSVSSVMKTAGSKKCGLCMAERTTIYYDMHHVEKSKKLMNKKSEIYGKCTCTARFQWLAIKKEVGC